MQWSDSSRPLFFSSANGVTIPGLNAAWTVLSDSDLLLHGSASKVVRMGRLVNGNRSKWTPYRSQTPSPIKTKLNKIHYVRGNSSRAKTHNQPIKGARPTKGQHISFLLVFSFLFCSFLCSAPCKNGSTDFDDPYVKRRGFTQEGAFWGSNASKYFQGVCFPPNTAKLGP